MVKRSAAMSSCAVPRGTAQLGRAGGTCTVTRLSSRLFPADFDLDFDEVEGADVLPNEAALLGFQRAKHIIVGDGQANVVESFIQRHERIRLGGELRAGFEGARIVIRRACAPAKVESGCIEPKLAAASDELNRDDPPIARLFNEKTLFCRRNGLIVNGLNVDGRRRERTSAGDDILCALALKSDTRILRRQRLAELIVTGES